MSRVTGKNFGVARSAKHMKEPESTPWWSSRDRRRKIFSLVWSKKNGRGRQSS